MGNPILAGRKITRDQSEHILVVNSNLHGGDAMKSLGVRVFAGGALAGDLILRGDLNFSVGSAPSPNSVVKIPSISIDCDELPPFFIVAQFKDGKLFVVHHLNWLAVEEDGVIRPECGIELRPASDGKLVFEFKSRQHSVCRIELEVRE